jgi:hypothetical protein
MNRLIIPFAFFAIMGVACANSNTIFARTGIINATAWDLNIYSTYNTSYDLFIPSIANTITTNALAITCLFTANGQCSSAYSYLAGFNAGGAQGFLYLDSVIWVNAGGNNIVDFTPSAATINASYSLCGVTFAQHICVPAKGSLINISTLTSPYGSSHSGNLTIYINPAGYFEYVFQNQSLGSNPATKLPQSSYLNTLPDQLDNNLTLTLFGKVAVTLFKGNSINVSSASNSSVISTSLQGEIFYSGLIDISPIESYGSIGGNLTPQTFADFIYANLGSFDNTTMIYNFNLYNNTNSNYSYASNEGLFLEYGINILSSAAFGILTPLFFGGAAPATLSSHGINEVPFSMTTSKAVPIMLQTIPNSTATYPIFVSYVYPNESCSLINGICEQSGQQGMYNFDTYVDEVSAPQILMSNFLSTDAIAILAWAFIILIIKKINGET